MNRKSPTDIVSERQQKVYAFLEFHRIPFTFYTHPEGKTIDEAKRWWRADGSIHCKNIFLRNHKGNRHYLVCIDSNHDLDIHELELKLKNMLQMNNQPSCGKLSFASPERMSRYLGLEPGSVSPFGLINDTERHVHLFLDANLQNANKLSFHPNDCRATIVISRQEFENYLSVVGNDYEYIDLY